MISKHIDEILKACIHCGMCLPACPTYQVTGNEANSPRGRIYIVDDLIKNPLEGPDETKINYLDDCLNCLACETVCPSNVEYGNILEYARENLGKSNYNKGLGGLIRKLVFNFLLPNRKRLKIFRDLYSVVSKIIPLQKFSKLSPQFTKPYREIKTDFIYKSSPHCKDSEQSEEVEATPVEIATPIDASLCRAHDDGTTNETLTVILPLGCVMDTVYNDVHWDTIKVLNAFGYDVYIPPSNCCGALAYHSHEEKIGKAQLNQTEKILEAKSYPVISNSAGCGAFMKSHSKLPVMDLIEILNQAPYNPLSPEVSEIQMLSSRGATLSRAKGSDVVISPSDHKQLAIYHPACHLNHAQGIAYDYLPLLKQIPGLEFEELYEADMCCGSAGFYNLIKPDLADAIGKRKASNIKNNQAKLVITANPGCMSQIQAQLGSNFEVKHPVTVLAEYLHRHH